MSDWSGGIHTYLNGFIAYVPTKADKMLRKFSTSYQIVEDWQHRAGQRMWGKHWGEVKAYGPVHYWLIPLSKSESQRMRETQIIQAKQAHEKSKEFPWHEC